MTIKGTVSLAGMLSDIKRVKKENENTEVIPNLKKKEENLKINLI